MNLLAGERIVTLTLDKQKNDSLRCTHSIV